MRAREEQQDAITWLQVHNLIPLVSIIIGVVGVFNILSNKVELQNQTIQALQGQVNACLGRTETLQNGLNSQALDIKELQTKGSVKGASTSVYNTPYVGSTNPTPKQ